MQGRCPEKRTIHECVEYHCNQGPEKLSCSIRVNGNWISYTRGQFWHLVCRYSHLFASSCTGQKTLILFSKKLDIHLLAAYIGAMRTGCVPAMISLPSAKTSISEYRKRIEHIRQITKFGALFTDSTDMENFGEMGSVRFLTPENLDDILGSDTGQKGGDALVQFSSGSTGLQKGVVLTHDAVIAHMQSYSAALRLDEEDAIVSWLPLYHDMGLIACYLMPLMCGIRIYQMDPFDWIMQPDLMLRVIEEQRPTVAFLPNFAYHVLANKGEVRDLSSIRLWVNCSEPVRAATHEQFIRKFPSVAADSLTVCYAMAENTFAVSQTLPWEGNSTRQDAVTGVVSCGMPIPGVEIRIFDGLESGEGEIGIRSPSMFKQFLDGSLPLRDGFYMTGDMGFLGDTGEVFVSGRKKDIIIVHGKNVFPQDVEYAASGLVGVYPGRVVAFGEWNEDIGSEELIVLVECQADVLQATLKIAIQKAVQEEVGIVPKRVGVLEHMSLVKTSSGKISRSRNKEIYQAKGFNIL